MIQHADDVTNDTMYQVEKVVAELVVAVKADNIECAITQIVVFRGEGTDGVAVNVRQVVADGAVRGASHRLTVTVQIGVVVKAAPVGVAASIVVGQYRIALVATGVGLQLYRVAVTLITSGADRVGLTATAPT